MWSVSSFGRLLRRWVSRSVAAIKRGLTRTTLHRILPYLSSDTLGICKLHNVKMPLSIDFTGKLVLITGGGRGIGLAITNAIAEGKSPRPHLLPVLSSDSMRASSCVLNVSSSELQPVRISP